MSNTKNEAATDYGTGWKAARGKAQQLADAHGKPVTVYREVADNRPAGFKLYVEGDATGRPDGAYRLETVQPKAADRKVTITVTDPDGVILDRMECRVRAGVRELTVMEVLPGTSIIERQVTSLAIGDGK